MCLLFVVGKVLERAGLRTLLDAFAKVTASMVSKSQLMKGSFCREVVVPDHVVAAVGPLFFDVLCLPFGNSFALVTVAKHRLRHYSYSPTMTCQQLLAFFGKVVLRSREAGRTHVSVGAVAWWFRRFYAPTLTSTHRRIVRRRRSTL